MTYRSQVDPALADALNRHESRIAALEAAGAVDLSDYALVDDPRLDTWSAKRVRIFRSAELGSAAVTGTRVFTPGIQGAGPWLPASAGTSTGVAAFRLDPADLPTLTGYDKKIWVRGTIATNSTAPGTTVFTFELRNVTLGATAPALVQATAGSVVASKAPSSPPGASNGGEAYESTAVAYPSAGFYVASLTNTVATTATNSAEAFTWTLLEGWAAA